MTIDELKKSGYIIYEVIGGSHAYGTQNADSDKDIRGIFVYPDDMKTMFHDHPQEIADDTQDIKYYELEKFMRLCAENNPNIIELLWVPEDCILYKDARMDIILANRDKFVSQKAYHTFNGYAYAQIQKAKGKNKKVNNPKSVERPKKEDYCFIISNNLDLLVRVGHYLMSSRPEKLQEFTHRYETVYNEKFDLNQCNCAKLEQTENVYRLYRYGTGADSQAKGVFRGDENLVTESISLADEAYRYFGLLIYNENAYKRDVAEWKSYWEWVNTRNNKRWENQENGLNDYDSKNIMHCYRLLLSGINILTNGVPIVRFEGEDLEYLRDIRAGKFKYNVIMKAVEDRMKDLEVLKDTTKLRYSVDNSFINDIYKQVVNYVQADKN